MPDLVMHHHFSHVVYTALDDTIKNCINNIGLYDFASVGPDPFFFVSFLNKEKNKVSYDFGQYMHTHNTKNFLVELVNLCKLNKDLFPYLCGYISHYYLDSNIHPYIFYKTGVYNSNIFNTIKYRGLHTKLERGMDCYIIENYYSTNPNRFNITRKILNLKKLPKTIIHDIDVLYKKVYDINEAAKYVNKSIRYQRLFYSFVFDPLGIKSKLFNKLDNGKSNLDYHYLSYYNKTLDTRKFDIFNFKHEKWTNPVDEKISSIDSFFELFDKAKLITIKCITDLYHHIFLDEDIDLDCYFGNLSYLTGLPCDQNQEMKYFNIIFK